MTKNSLIWTAMWFTFIILLCLIFKNGYSLFLLIIWFFGVYVEE